MEIKKFLLYFSRSLIVIKNLSQKARKEKHVEIKEEILFDEILTLSIIVSKMMSGLSFFKKEAIHQVTIWATPGANRAPIGIFVKEKSFPFIFTTKNL